MRVYLRTRVTRQPSGCLALLMTFGVLGIFMAIASASPAAGFTIIALGVAGAVAWLFVPVWLHRNHTELTPGCRLCAATVAKLRAAEREQAEHAAYARLSQKYRR